MCNSSDLIEERAIEKGIERGREEGRQEGKLSTLLTQIKKKFAKGKSLEQIADELEETVENIRPLYEQVQAEMN